MKPRAISASDVQIGDLISLHAQGLVTGWDYGNEVSGYFTFDGQGLTPHCYSGMKVFLLDRPLPPIPTRDGTIIRHKAGRLTALVWRKDDAWCDGNGVLPDSFAPTRAEYDVLVPEATS